MYRVRITFCKGQEARFLSHLDLMATLEYAIRRARLPVELSEGFNPRPRLSLAAPLPLGYLAEREILEVALRRPTSVAWIQERLQASLPVGVSVLSVDELPSGQKLAASRVKAVRYRVELPTDVADLNARLTELLGRPSLSVEEWRDDGMRKRDIRPLILSMEASGPGSLRLTARHDDRGTVRPEQILQLLLLPLEGARITREGIDLND